VLLPRMTSRREEDMFYYYRIAYLILPSVDKTLLLSDHTTGLPTEGG
jgi:hypothetical protein